MIWLAFIGALLTGVFCAPYLGGAGFGVEMQTMGAQLGVQVIGIVATVIYTGVTSFIILKVIDVIIGLRVSSEQETEGLDLVLHDEKGYNW